MKPKEKAVVILLLLALMVTGVSYQALAQPVENQDYVNMPGTGGVVVFERDMTNDLTYDQRMIRCCNTLVEAGYDVTLVGRELPDSIPLADKPFAQVRLQCDRKSGPGFYAEYNIRLRGYLMDADYDLGIACDLDTIMALGIVGRQRDIPFVYDAHEYFSEVPEVVGRPVVRSIWRMIGMRYVPRADASYTVAPQLAGKLEEEYGVKFGVVRNVPFKSADAVVPFAERESVILYQGALNEGRGLEVAIEAMRQLDGFVLRLAGEGDLSSKLRDMASELGVADRVEFLGRVRPERLCEHTQKAMIGLNLLENRGMSYYYSLANKFFDYIQAGTPSINMDFPEYAAINDQYAVGSLLDELDADTLARHIRKLSDPGEWERCSLACEAARSEFHWEREKDKLIAIMRGVL